MTRSKKILLVALTVVLVFCLCMGVLVGCDTGSNSGSNTGKDTSKDTSKDQGGNQSGNQGGNQGQTQTKQVTITVLVGDQTVGSQTATAGSILDSLDFPYESDMQYTYTFSGWDANGDGIAETFPYTCNADTTFKAMYTQEYVKYHYDIYVSGKLNSSIDAHYGDDLTYPEVKSSVTETSAFFFQGWSYNGTFNGLTYLQAGFSEDTNVRIDAVFQTSQIVKYIYGGQIYAEIADAGATLTFLKDWSVTAPSGSVIQWFSDSGYTKPYTGTVMPTGNLTLYGKAVKQNAVREGTIVSSQSALQDEFDMMILNRVASKKFITNFKYSSLNSLLTSLQNNALSLYSYKVSAKATDDELTISFTFDPINNKTSTAVYSQVNSLSVVSVNSNRGSAFDSFAINSATNTMEVANSDALYYALEHGNAPLIDASNTQLANLYSTMKGVLRTIITNEMDDYEKAKAIYEWLIMNVSYDGAVLTKMQNGSSDLAEYRSFYLEGVFEDHLAVCDGISKAFASLCNMEGISCVRVTGETSEGVSHAWNKVKIDGNWYVVDATAGGVISNNKEFLTYAYFLLSGSEYASHATEDGKYYASTKCTKSYNTYSKLSVMLGGADRKQLCASKADAGALLKAFMENAPANSSIDFKLSYTSLGLNDQEAAKSALEDIMKEASYSGSISYLYIMGSFILYK